jgi:hypothetical protein
MIAEKIIELAVRFVSCTIPICCKRWRSMSLVVTNANGPAMPIQTNPEVVKSGTPHVGADQPLPDLLWDNEVRGLCVRVRGDAPQSFIFG